MKCFNTLKSTSKEIKKLFPRHPKKLAFKYENCFHERTSLNNLGAMQTLLHAIRLTYNRQPFNISNHPTPCDVPLSQQYNHK